MLIGGLQKTSLIDYPDKLAAIIFTAGCNFRCGFCYNPELVTQINKKNLIPEKEILDFLEKRRKVLDGAVITGGEPTMHKDLPKFIRRVRKMGYLVKLDTNGSNPEILKELIDNNLIDYAAMDIKGPKEKYTEIAGFKNCSNFYLIDKIEKSINTLKKGNIDYEFRTTLTPSLLGKEDVIKIANWISPAKKYFLQNFQPQKTINPIFSKIKPYPDEYLAEIKKAISPLFEVCSIR